MAAARVLASNQAEYVALSERLLPPRCPRCGADKKYLVLDSEDKDFAYCWSHFSEIFIGPVRSDKPDLARDGYKVINTHNKRPRNGRKSKND